MVMAPHVDQYQRCSDLINTREKLTIGEENISGALFFIIYRVLLNAKKTCIKLYRRARISLSYTIYVSRQMKGAGAAKTYILFLPTLYAKSINGGI